MVCAVRLVASAEPDDDEAASRSAWSDAVDHAQPSCVDRCACGGLRIFVDVTCLASQVFGDEQCGTGSRAAMAVFEREKGSNLVNMPLARQGHDMKETVGHWLGLAEYDIETARRLRRDDRGNGGIPVLDKAAAIATVQRYAEVVTKELSPFAVVLFGSFVHGVPHGDSDIDVGVVFDGSVGDYRQTAARLWRMRRGISFDIEPHLLDRANDKSGFVQHVLATGYIVYHREQTQAEMSATGC